MSTPKKQKKIFHSSPHGSLNKDESVKSSVEHSILSDSTDSSNDVSEEVYIGEDYDSYLRDLGRIYYRGKIWKKYKPVNRNTLYALILTDPANNNIADELLDDFQNRRLDVLKSLIELCIHLSGYINYKLPKDIIWKPGYSNAILNSLKNYRTVQENELVQKGCYLFREGNIKMTNILKIGVFNFIQKFIYVVHAKEILYDEQFMVTFLEFIKSMQTSDLRCLLHTGVVFAVKILTSLILVYNEVINDSNFPEDSSSLESLNNSHAIQLVEQKTALDNLIECLFLIFKKKFRSEDPKLSQMTVECIFEVQIWIKYSPKLFISTYKILHYISKLLYEPSNKIRLTALETFEGVLNIRGAVEYMKSYEMQIMKSIAERFSDIDEEIAKKAIEYYTYLLYVNQSVISEKNYTDLIRVIFGVYAPRAIAASTFYVKFFQVSKYAPENILLAIADIYLNKPKKEYLVEGFLYMCEHMQNWGLYCSLILSDKIATSKKVAVTEIFGEAWSQTVKGKSNLERKMSKTIAEVDISQHENLAKNFRKLLNILDTQKDARILIEILNIFLLLDYRHLDNSYYKEYMELAAMIAMLSETRGEDSILKKASQVLFHICNLPELTVNIQKISNMLCNETIQLFHRFMDDSTERNFLPARRLSALYEFWNFNKEILYQHVFYLIGEKMDQADVEILNCCKWYLIWCLKETIENKAHDQKSCEKMLREMPELCTNFCNIAFKMLQTSQRDEGLLIEVYRALCDFFFLFDKELTVLKKANKMFMGLEMKIEKINLRVKLFEFLEKHIISNKNITLFERRSLVTSYINLICSGVLPLQNFCNIFQYYYVYNKEYGPIIDQFISSLAANKYLKSSVTVLVDVTIIKVFKDIQKKNGMFDIRSEDASLLTNLVNQFHKSSYFETGENDLVVASILLKEALKDKNNVPLLIYIEIWLRFLKCEDTIMKIYDELVKLTPRSEEKNELVLSFAKWCKEEISKKKKNKTSTSRNKENIGPKSARKKKREELEDESDESEESLQMTIDSTSE